MTGEKPYNEAAGRWVRRSSAVWRAVVRAPWRRDPPRCSGCGSRFRVPAAAPGRALRFRRGVGAVETPLQGIPEHSVDPTASAVMRVVEC